jgi:hypothetical protein
MVAIIGVAELMYEMHLKFRVGAIHEASEITRRFPPHVFHSRHCPYLEFMERENYLPCDRSMVMGKYD